MTLSDPSSDATGGPAAARRNFARLPSGLAPVLAFAGVLETAWLALTMLGQAHVPCMASAQHDCEQLLAVGGSGPAGVPLLAWGLAAYILTFVLAITMLRAGARLASFARSGFVVLAIGMGVASAGLMVRMLSLGARCPWCIVSAALAAGLAVIALAELTAGTVRWRALVAGVLLGGTWIVLMSTQKVDGTSVLARSQPDSAFVRRLARHLNASGARFYGVWWCVDCRDQKDAFGTAATELPYVECSREPAPDWVTQFPAWEIGGWRHFGVIALDTLAARSRFDRR